MATLVGLTGGIGSGKSTVLQMLAQLGAAVIDADVISRSVTGTGGSAIAQITERFGAHFITREGALDRVRMREHAYANADTQARQHLEDIIHPLVGAQSEREVQAALDAGAACIVFDIPLLVESGRWRQRLERVLVVDCTPATQLARVVARSGLAPDEVRRIIAAQAPREIRLAAADVVIWNEELTLGQLQAEVAQAGHLFGL
ncbi:MAG: dephospho-CoA kinase [Ramlibacter sp.]